MNIPQEVQMGVDWLCDAMAEWDAEMVDCDWDIITDVQNRTVTVNWTVDDFNDETGKEESHTHVDVFTFSEVIHGVQASKPVLAADKDWARYAVFEIAVQIMRSSNSN